MLDDAASMELLQAAHTRSFAPNQTLVHEGDQAESMYLIIEGSVSCILETPSGRELVLAYLGPGDFVGEMGLFPQRYTRSAAVRTRTPTLAAEISYGRFRTFAQEHPDIMFELAGQISARLHTMTRRLSDIAFLDVAGRIASLLAILSRSPDARLHPNGTLISISRIELARLAGCSREMAGRALKQLESDRVVAAHGRKILLLHNANEAGRAIIS